MIRFPSSTFFAIAATCLLLSGCGSPTPDSGTALADADKEWLLFETPDGKMTAKFPIKPKLVENTAPSAIGDLEIKMGVAEIGRKLVYTASSISYPVDPAEYDVEAGLQGAVDSIKGEVISDTKITKDECSGRDLLVKTSAGPYIRARTYIDGAGPTLYQVNVTALSKESLDSDDTVKFLDSIEFIKE